MQIALSYPILAAAQAPAELPITDIWLVGFAAIDGNLLLVVNHCLLIFTLRPTTGTTKSPQFGLMKGEE